MTDLRCSVVTAASGVRAAGSATAARRFVLVELPLPWPKPIASHPLLAAVDITSTPGVRVLAIADETDDTSGHRVLVYDRILEDDETGTPRFAGYALSETTVSTAELSAHLTTVIADTTPPVRADAALTMPRDLLICTQGSHDRCCGSFGTELYRQLVNDDAIEARVWRTSHTGGHRFAPTGVTFPDGLMWAGLDHEQTAGILDRTIEVAQLDPLLRGCCGIDSAVGQIADAAALVNGDWGWLSEPRSVLEQPAGESDSDSTRQVRVVGRHGGETASYVVTVEPGPSVPVPPCGKEIELATKSSRQWAMTSFVSD